MAKPDDGGPAFPVPQDAKPDEHGMSLRDWFAGLTMQALITYGEADKMDITRQAYVMADAMLEEREKVDE